MTRIPKPFPRPRPHAPAGDAAAPAEAGSIADTDHRAGRSAGPASPDEYPCCSEHLWERRLTRRPTRPLPEAASGLPDVVMDYLVESALADALDGLGLNPLERAVAEMRLAGASVREIAAASGLKKWRIERALAVVRRRLMAARHAALPDAPSSPTRRAIGWQDVYLAETRRRGKK